MARRLRSRIGKKLVQSAAVNAVLCWLAATYIRFVQATSRWEVLGAENVEPYWRDGKPFIWAFWHGRLLMLSKFWPTDRRKLFMLISEHRDGRLITETTMRFGFDLVPGSSGKGGTAALRGIIRLLKSGECVGITPDGPRGPRMRATTGTIDIARLSGAPIIPATYSVRRGRAVQSWDRFLIPLPFTRGVISWGVPIHVDKGAPEGTQRARAALEEALIRMTDEADRLCDREPIEPAPEPVPVP